MVIEGQKIEKINSKEGNRFLGIFFTHNNNRAVHIKKMKNMIEGFVKIMRRKVVTDKQVCKLWNINMIPALEYQLLGVVISEIEARQLMAPVNTLIKHKSKIPSSLPNCIIYDKDLYGVKDLYSLQLESLSKNIMYMANGNEILKKIFKIQMEQLRNEMWTPLCFAEKVSDAKFSSKRYVGDALIMLGNHNFRLCDHENQDDLFKNHRIKGGNILIEDVLEDDYKFYKNRIRKCGVLFVEQVLEPYTNKMMKWTHFLKENNLALRIEPKWYKIIKDRITINGILERELNNEVQIKRSELELDHLMRDEIYQGSRKESNKEVITWKNNINDLHNIYSIRMKKSRHHYYDEIGRHLVEYDELQNNNDASNSPFLINCKGCEYNISRKNNKNMVCLIYVEKDRATTIKGRWERNIEGEKYIKPYSTLENINKNNEILLNSTVDQTENKIAVNDMVVDREEKLLIIGARLWLDNIVEDIGIYTRLRDFLENNFTNFVDKEIILKIGGVIQKGSEFDLDGFFGIEIFPKISDAEKFSIEGKIARVRNERKLYAIAIIVALTIIPENAIVDLRTEMKILEWLKKYHDIGSVRRELDDQCYIFLNCINTMLELKNIKLIIISEKAGIMESTRDVKIPELKKELIRCKDSIQEVVIKYSSILVDEYALRWNYNPIEGAYRKCFKEISNNITKIDIILLDNVKDCFVECNGANMTIDWKESFKLINNEISTPRNVTSRLDASIRTFRVKNFFHLLPTYEILFDRKVWGIPNKKCPRCILEDETWDHIWICGKNGHNEFNLFKASIEEVFDQEMIEEEDDTIEVFKSALLEIAANKSRIMLLDNILREVTRGLINEKWMKVCSNVTQKRFLREIFDRYLIKLQQKIWIERCDEVINIEKQMGIYKDLKRKKRIEDTNDTENEDDNLENSYNMKNKKKIKKIIKTDLENDVKNNVFSLGSYNRHRIGNRVISNLVNT